MMSNGWPVGCPVAPTCNVDGPAPDKSNAATVLTIFRGNRARIYGEGTNSLPELDLRLDATDAESIQVPTDQYREARDFQAQVLDLVEEHPTS